ncbi:hypothetical protein [Malacoplasma muris]|uniref:hypothetical protein n=1 Tax=Malacoplasma muris TaxID=2119 RepID=UPI00398F2A3B
MKFRSKKKFKAWVTTLISSAFIAVPSFMFLTPNNNLSSNATHLESAKYIEENLDFFKKEINNNYSTKFNPSYIEYKNVFNLYGEENKSVSYLDFNSTNGYLILGDNLELLDISLDLELSYLKNTNKEISYSRDFGFLYYENDKWNQFNENYSLEKSQRLQKLDGSNDNEQFDPNDIVSVNQNYTTFLINGDGPPEKPSTETGHIIGKPFGPGYIINEYKYLEKHHGKNYFFYDDHYLRYWEYTVQDDFSVYRNNLTGSGEGNCLLTSLYLTLKYMHETNQIKFENVWVDSDHSITGVGQWQSVFDNYYFIPEKEENSLYNDLINKDWFLVDKGKNTLVEVNNNEQKEYDRVEIPFLYSKIREVAKQFGYTHESSIITPIFVETITKTVVNRYSKSKKNFFQRQTNIGFSIDFNSFFVKPIKNNTPVMWNFFHEQFGVPHSIVVTGYKRYVIKQKVLLFYTNSFVNLLMVNDNHNDFETWFDISHIKLDALWGLVNIDLNLGVSLTINK